MLTCCRIKCTTLNKKRAVDACVMREGSVTRLRCTVAPMECFLEDGLTRGEVDALNADDIPVPEPEHDYDWYSIPFQRNSSESSADATDNAVFEALMANRKVHGAPRRSRALLLTLWCGNLILICIALLWYLGQALHLI